MKTFKFAVVGFLVAAMVLAGCASKPVTAPPAAPPTETASAPSPAAPAAPAAPAVPAGALGEADWSVVKVFLPATDGGGTVFLEKAAPREVLVGKDFDYRIRVTNCSNTALDGAILTGKLSPDLKVTSTTPEAKITGTDAVWAIGKLEPKQSKVFTVRGSATKVGTVTGCSDLTFTVPSACVSTKVVEPALKLVQTAPAEVLICEAIPIRVVVSNPGSGTVSATRVTVTLPEGLKAADGKSEALVDAGTLAPGQSKECTVQARADKAGEFTAKSAATGDGLTATADSKTTVRQPVLAVAKDGPKVRYAGTPVTYTITVTNNGDGEARNTVLTDAVPVGSQFTSASDNGKNEGLQVVWNLGTIAPKESKKVTVVLKAVSIGTLDSTAAASATCAKASARATTEVKGIPGLLLEMVDVTDPIAIGEQETYIITITNQGTSDGTNIVVTADVPGEQEFVSASGDTKGAAEGQKVTFEAMKTLAPKAKATWKVVTKATKEADSRFKVSFTSDQTQEPVYKTESTHLYSDK